MAGASGISSKGGPKKAKQFNVLRLQRGNDRVHLSTKVGSKRVLFQNSKGEAKTMTLGAARQRIRLMQGAGFKRVANR